jgi:hypothetical protein
MLEYKNTPSARSSASRTGNNPTNAGELPYRAREWGKGSRDLTVSGPLSSQSGHGNCDTICKQLPAMTAAMSSTARSGAFGRLHPTLHQVGTASFVPNSRRKLANTK